MTHDTLWTSWLSRWCDMTALGAGDIFAFLGPRLMLPFSVILAVLQKVLHLPGELIRSCWCRLVKSQLSISNLLNSSWEWKFSWNIVHDSYGMFSPKSVRVLNPSVCVCWFPRLFFFGLKPLIEVRKFPMKTVYTVFGSLQWFRGL